MGIFNQIRRPAPTYEDMVGAGVPPNVARWRLQGPPPGEVTIDPGDAPATERVKLVHYRTPGELALLWTVGEITSDQLRAQSQSGIDAEEIAFRAFVAAGRTSSTEHLPD